MIFSRKDFSGTLFDFHVFRGGSARRNAYHYALDRMWSWLPLVLMGRTGWRKRSNLNPLTSVRCEGIGIQFFCISLKSNEIFHVILFIFLPNHFAKIWCTSFSSDDFLMYFFLPFWYSFMYFHLTILVFRICLYGNYIYLLVFPRYLHF